MPVSADKMSQLEDKELLNGRLAMIGFMGIFHQSFIFEKDFPYF